MGELFAKTLKCRTSSNLFGLAFRSPPDKSKINISLDELTAFTRS